MPANAPRPPHTTPRRAEPLQPDRPDRGDRAENSDAAQSTPSPQRNTEPRGPADQPLENVREGYGKPPFAPPGPSDRR